MHRIYGLPFKTPALVVEKDALFIPCGWDNEKKISILYENIHTVSPEDTFEKVICKPDQLSLTGQEVEVTAEDDQNFLAKMQSQLTQNIPSSANTPAQTFRPSPSVPRGSERKPIGANVTSSPVSYQLVVSHITLITCGYFHPFHSLIATIPAAKAFYKTSSIHC